MSNSFTKLYFVEPSVVARRLLWHVLSLGQVTLDQPDYHEGFDKPGAHFFWVVSGEGEMRLGARTYHLSKGPRCWLADLRQPRTYVPATGRPLTTAGFRFSGQGLEAWLESFAASNEFAFTDARDVAFIRTAQKKLLTLVRRRPGGYEWRAHDLIAQVLGRLLRNRNVLASGTTEIPPAVTRVINAILANPARDWRVRELAAIAGISYSGLRAQFKEFQHESVHEFLQRTRLDCARLLLSDQRLSIKEVADRLNFSSEFYFSHFFRKQTGISPSKFRERCRI